jgi:hypothetical protein
MLPSSLNTKSPTPSFSHEISERNYMYTAYGPMRATCPDLLIFPDSIVLAIVHYEYK